MSGFRHWSFWTLWRVCRLPEWLEYLMALSGLLWTGCAVFSQDSPWRRATLSLILWPWAPFWIFFGVALCIAHLAALRTRVPAARLGAVATSAMFWNHNAWGVVGALIIHGDGDIPLLLSPDIVLALICAGLTYRMAAGIGLEAT